MERRGLFAQPLFARLALPANTPFALVRPVASTTLPAPLPNRPSPAQLLLTPPRLTRRKMARVTFAATMLLALALQAAAFAPYVWA